MGRGCWAGPLVAGAVVLNKPIKGLDDSKKLSKLQRQRRAADIEVEAAAFGLGWVEPDEIDQLGLTKSVRLAMERALTLIDCMYDEIVIDGNFNFFPENPKCRALIKADSLVPAVSAASIIAKVARDNFMCSVAAKRFPGYDFDKHAGYGTALHIEKLKHLGACEIHRKSYKPIQEIMVAA